VTDEAPTPTADEAAKRPVVAQQVSAPVSGTDVVTICCKIPNGLILRAFEQIEEVEASLTGPRKYIIVKGIVGTEFSCQGPAQINHITSNMFDLMSRSYPGGYALTHGCPRDVWESWLHWNKNTPIYTEGLVFAVADPADAAMEAKSRASLRSGLEPLDPANPSLTVKGIQPGVPE
jgi:hypothetical protein